jgi:AbrB family looped-hinge helix DNA binding protein
MENEIIVKKNGETKIPAGIRKKFQIEEGTKLDVVETSEGILLKPKPKQSTWDLIGAYSHVATPEEVKKEIDKLREQDE